MSNICYCRVCWNTNGWQRPSGDAPKLEMQSYVKTNGFGHEEWIFNFGWTIEGYKYGFIQGFNTKNQIHQGKTLDVRLYTIFGKKKYYVGKIINCYILTYEEASHALATYRKQGWLDEMIDDVKRIKGNHQVLIEERNPLYILNLRFRIDDVNIYDPLNIEIPKSHPIFSHQRYKPRFIPEDFASPPISGKITSGFVFRSGRRKTDEEIWRAVQFEGKYDPNHNRLQNSLFDYLVGIYGKENVGYESSNIDLVVKEGESFIFFEIKTEPTARKSIRPAIGQLLEYAHWSSRDLQIKELRIIGKVLPTDDEKKYLEFLRHHYNLSLYYQRYDASSNLLSEKF